MPGLIWKLYLYRFLDDCILIYPLYSLLFQSSGLNLSQISLLFAIWAGTALLLEIPTGILADKFSRQKLLILGQLLRALGYSIWLIYPHFWGFAVGFVLWAIKGSLTSGTLEAFVFDELKTAGHENNYQKVTGYLHAAGFVGITAAMVLGGLVGRSGYTAALLPSIVMPFVAAGLLATLNPVQSRATTASSLVVFRQAFRRVLSHPPLMKLTLYTAIIFGVYGEVDEFWALLFNHLGLSVVAIGVLLAAGNIIAGLGSRFAPHIHLPHASIITVAVSGLMFIVVGFFPHPASLILVFAATFILEIARIKLDANLQHLITVNERATVTSINNLILEIMALLSMLVISVLTQYTGLIAILFFMGITFMVASLAFARNLRLLPNT